MSQNKKIHKEAVLKLEIMKGYLKPMLNGKFTFEEISKNLQVKFSLRRKLIFLEKYIDTYRETLRSTSDQRSPLEVPYPILWKRSMLVAKLFFNRSANSHSDTKYDELEFSYPGKQQLLS